MKLQKLVPAMARHVQKHAAAIGAQETLGERPSCGVPPSQDSNKILDSHFIALVVHLNSVYAQVRGMRRRMVHLAYMGEQEKGVGKRRRCMVKGETVG
jgi:hypothetical protein